MPRYYLESLKSQAKFIPIINFVSNFSLVVIAAGLSRLLTFIASILLARQLGVEQFGIFTTAYTIIMLVGQLPSVIDVAFVRKYTELNILDKNTLTRTFLYIKIAIFAIILIFSLAFGNITAHFVFRKYGTELSLALVAGGAFSVFSSWLAFYQSKSHFVKYASVNFLQSSLGLIFIILYLSYFHSTANGALKVYTFTYSLLGLITTVFLYLKSKNPSWTSFISQTKSLLMFTGWLIPASILYTLLQRIDVLLLTRFSDYYQIGLYGSAIRIIAIVSIFTGNLSVIFLPKAAKAMQSIEGVKSYLLQSFIAVSGISLVIIVGIIWTPLIIRLTMGEEYVVASSALRILLIGYIFIAIASPLSCLVYGVNRTDIIFFERLLELGVAFFGGILLIPNFGVVGASLSLCLAYFVGALFIIAFNLRWIRKNRLGGNVTNL